MWITIQDKIDACCHLGSTEWDFQCERLQNEGAYKRKGGHLIDAYYENSRTRTFRPILATNVLPVVATNIDPVETAVTTFAPTSLLSPLLPVNLVQRYAASVNDAAKEPQTSTASHGSSSSVSWSKKLYMSNQSSLSSLYLCKKAWHYSFLSAQIKST